MIELINVTKRFGNKTAVDSVSFEVKKGEIVGFLGPNGAGKTTTMRVITGFFPASEGTVKVAGFDLSKDPLRAREKIGYLPESAPLYKELSVRGYLRFIAGVKGVDRKQAEAKINKAMQETGTVEVADTIIGKLSKGFRQRVGLAQAILNDPDVLILDEPTVGLDPKQIKEIRSLIKQMKGERTIILSTHILPEVSVTCDKVVVINDGKIILQDEVKNLGKKTHGGARIHVEAEAPKSQFIPEIKGVKGVSAVAHEQEIERGVNYYVIDSDEGADPRPEIAKTVVKNRWALLEMRREAVSLEDVFLRLVTKEEA